MFSFKDGGTRMAARHSTTFSRNPLAKSRNSHGLKQSSVWPPSVCPSTHSVQVDPSQNVQLYKHNQFWLSSVISLSILLVDIATFLRSIKAFWNSSHRFFAVTFPDRCNPSAAVTHLGLGTRLIRPYNLYVHTFLGGRQSLTGE